MNVYKVVILLLYIIFIVVLSVVSTEEKENRIVHLHIKNNKIVQTDLEKTISFHTDTTINHGAVVITNSTVTTPPAGHTEQTTPSEPIPVSHFTETHLINSNTTDQSFTYSKNSLSSVVIQLTPDDYTYYLGTPDKITISVDIVYQTETTFKMTSQVTSNVNNITGGSYDYQFEIINNTGDVILFSNYGNRDFNINSDNAVNITTTQKTDTQYKNLRASIDYLINDNFGGFYSATAFFVYPVFKSELNTS